MVESYLTYFGFLRFWIPLGFLGNIINKTQFRWTTCYVYISFFRFGIGFLLLLNYCFFIFLPFFSVSPSCHLIYYTNIGMLLPNVFCEIFRYKFMQNWFDIIEKFSPGDHLPLLVWFKILLENIQTFDSQVLTRLPISNLKTA